MRNEPLAPSFAIIAQEESEVAMEVSRRNLIAAAGLASAAASTLRGAAPALPDKKEFPVVKAEVCLNNARWHPIGLGATRAVQELSLIHI